MEMTFSGNGGDFGVATVFSGYGFSPSEASQTTDHSSSFHNDSCVITQTLIPLTVNQIIKASQSNDNDFQIDGVHFDFVIVKLVGMVLNKSERVTDVSFLLDDGTARIECTKWAQEPVDTKEELEAISEGMYVRVHGSLVSFLGRKKVMVVDIKRVTDFDEITRHFVECIYLHSYNTKLSKLEDSTSDQSVMPSSVFNTQTYQSSLINQVPRQYAEKLGVIHKRILTYLNLQSSIAREEGIHQDELATQLGIPLDEILTALEFLQEDGLVYPYVDVFTSNALTMPDMSFLKLLLYGMLGV